MVIEDKTDIRPTIRARLQAVEAELADLPHRQRKLEVLRDSLKALLEHEDAVRGGDNIDESLVPAFHPTADRRTLADLIILVLGTGPKTLEQLKEIGAAWPPVRDSAFPGRALNFALVGLQKGGHVERLENGAWRLAPEKSGNDTDMTSVKKKVRYRKI